MKKLTSPASSVAEPLAAVADHLDGDRVAGGRRRRDVGGGRACRTSASRSASCGERPERAAASGVAGQRCAAEERLEAAGVAAGAGGPVVLDPDVADVAGAAAHAAVDLAADHDAAADAGADLDEEEVVDAAGEPGVHARPAP